MYSGDRLFLYTDAFLEAMNENEEEYSDEKMINFLQVIVINQPKSLLIL
ncbi:MAG: hypothetical protein IPJ03_14415 [Ignavibacteriales bacterium]|nr:hypothetical protein [Ignavibacteriales bacterium]